MKKLTATQNIVLDIVRLGSAAYFAYIVFNTTITYFWHYFNLSNRIFGNVFDRNAYLLALIIVYGSIFMTYYFFELMIRLMFEEVYT